MPRTTLSLGESEYVLDARPDRTDHRDRPYQPRLVSLPPSWPTERDLKLALPYFSHMVDDQGRDGACTGFGLAAVINFVRWRDEVMRLPRNDRGLLAIDLDKVDTPAVSPFQLYHLARVYDEWKGEDYEGSSCRGAMKGFHKHGVCLKEYWTTLEAPRGSARELWQADAASRPLGAYYRVQRESINDLQAAIFEVGAVYASSTVHEGWELSGTHRQLPVIRKTPGTRIKGAHAFAIVGYERRGFIIQNSWGSDWGFYGFALLPYDDWASSAMDAWVAVMGAPTSVASRPDPGTNGAGRGVEIQAEALQSYRKDSLSLAATRTPGWRWIGDADSALATAPLSREEAYGLTIVLENEGRVVPRRVGYDSAEQVVHEIAHDLPLKWFRQLGEGYGPALKLMLYFHGGLNEEDDSLRRIEKMAPYFLANGIYPLFVTWRTGFLDSIRGILEDSLYRFYKPPAGLEARGWRDAIDRHVGDAVDRAIEVACQHFLAKPVWTQMKQNAEAGIGRGSGLYLLAQSLENLFEAVEDYELHLIGHSAGSLPIGHLLGRLQSRRVKVGSCRLFAPACTAAFANRHYGRAVRQEALAPDNFFLHILSDELERLDSVYKYGKSLLYLVSRALEINHKEPLLGLEYLHETDAANVPADFWHVPTSRRHTTRTNPDVERWQAETLPLIPTDNLRIATERNVSDGVTEIPQNHGSFDNNVALISEAISQIRGKDAEPRVDNLHIS